MPPDYVKETRFLEEARVELLAAVTYCEQIERGLGARFRDAVEAASALAAKLPGAGSPSNNASHVDPLNLIRCLMLGCQI